MDVYIKLIGKDTNNQKYILKKELDTIYFVYKCNFYD